MVLAQESADRPPVPERPIAQALHSGRPGENAGQAIAMPADETVAASRASAGSAGIFPPSSPVAVQQQSVQLDRPLRLSQMLLDPVPGGMQPRWMTLPDAPVPLRHSSELSVPQAVTGRSVSLSADETPGMVVAENSSSGVPKAGEKAVAASQTEEKKELQPFSLSAWGWEIPPIRWGGTLGYSLQTSKSSGGSSSNAQGVFANLLGSSYIYAPWFARITGRLGLTTNSSTNESSAHGASVSETSRGQNIVGGGEVNMFASSRYPFRIYFDRADSRVSGSIVSTDYVSNRFGLSQNFRAEDGLSSGGLIFDRSAVTSADGKRDEVTALSGSYSTQTGVVQNNFSGRYSLGQRSGTGDQARLIGVNSSHVANISDTLNLGATANYSDTDIRNASSLGGRSSNRGRYLQLYGYGSWLPDFDDIEDLPLTLSGGVRYSGQDAQFEGSSFSAQSLGTNLSALYRYSSNLSFSANSAVNKVTNSTGESQMLSQFGNAINYVGNPLSIGKFSYNWNTGLSANWQSAVATTPANSALNTQLTHSLSRMFSLTPGQTLSLNATQSLNVIDSQLLGTAQTLSNSLSANLGLNGGDRFSGNLSTMVSDVRTSGYLEQEYRVLNVGFYGQGQISQNSSATMNLMFNWSDQSYQSVNAYGLPVNQSNQRMTVNGSAAYNHQRFAGVRGLRYNLIFAADSRLRDERLYGNAYGEIDRARFSLTNRLDYRIGLLDFRLSLTTNEVGGKKNALLFFQVSRQIGSY